MTMIKYILLLAFGFILFTGCNQTTDSNSSKPTVGKSNQMDFSGTWNAVFTSGDILYDCRVVVDKSDSLINGYVYSVTNGDSLVFSGFQKFYLDSLTRNRSRDSSFNFSQPGFNDDATQNYTLNNITHIHDGYTDPIYTPTNASLIFSSQWSIVAIGFDHFPYRDHITCSRSN